MQWQDILPCHSWISKISEDLLVLPSDLIHKTSLSEYLHRVQFVLEINKEKFDVFNRFSTLTWTVLHYSWLFAITPIKLLNLLVQRKWLLDSSLIWLDKLESPYLQSSTSLATALRLFSFAFTEPGIGKKGIFTTVLVNGFCDEQTRQAGILNLQ